MSGYHVFHYNKYSTSSQCKMCAILRTFRAVFVAGTESESIYFIVVFNFPLG